MFKLQKFCCCVSLRIGTEIIGLLYLIGSLITLAGLVVNIVNFDAHGSISFKGYSPQLISKILAAKEGLNIAYKVINCTMFALCCIQIVIDILLIIAAATCKAKLALPWMVLNSVLLVINLFAFASVSIMGFVYQYPMINLTSIGPIVAGIIYIAVTLYAALVVNSFYDELKNVFSVSSFYKE